MEIHTTEELFATLPLADIRQLLVRTRGIAAEKSAELRQLVGDRYLDLLGTADEASHMLQGVRQLGLRVASLQQAATSLFRQQPWAINDASSLESKSDPTPPPSAPPVAASALDWLLAATEQVWRHVESGALWPAAILNTAARLVASQAGAVCATTVGVRVTEDAFAVAAQAQSLSAQSIAIQRRAATLIGAVCRGSDGGSPLSSVQPAVLLCHCVAALAWLRGHHQRQKLYLHAASPAPDQPSAASPTLQEAARSLFFEDIRAVTCDVLLRTAEEVVLKREKVAQADPGNAADAAFKAMSGIASCVRHVVIAVGLLVLPLPALVLGPSGTTKELSSATPSHGLISDWATVGFSTLLAASSAFYFSMHPVNPTESAQQESQAALSSLISWPQWRLQLQSRLQRRKLQSDSPFSVNVELQSAAGSQPAAEVFELLWRPWLVGASAPPASVLSTAPILKAHARAYSDAQVAIASAVVSWVQRAVVYVAQEAPRLAVLAVDGVPDAMLSPATQTSLPSSSRSDEGTTLSVGVPIASAAAYKGLRRLIARLRSACSTLDPEGSGIETAVSPVSLVGAFNLPPAWVGLQELSQQRAQLSTSVKSLSLTCNGEQSLASPASTLGGSSLYGLLFATPLARLTQLCVHAEWDEAATEIARIATRAMDAAAMTLSLPSQASLGCVALASSSAGDVARGPCSSGDGSSEESLAAELIVAAIGSSKSDDARPIDASSGEISAEDSDDPVYLRLFAESKAFLEFAGGRDAGSLGNAYPVALSLRHIAVRIGAALLNALDRLETMSTSAAAAVSSSAAVTARDGSSHFQSAQETAALAAGRITWLLHTLSEKTSVFAAAATASSLSTSALQGDERSGVGAAHACLLAALVASATIAATAQAATAAAERRGSGVEGGCSGDPWLKLQTDCCTRATVLLRSGLQAWAVALGKYCVAPAVQSWSADVTWLQAAAPATNSDGAETSGALSRRWRAVRGAWVAVDLDTASGIAAHTAGLPPLPDQLSSNSGVHAAPEQPAEAAGGNCVSDSATVTTTRGGGGASTLGGGVGGVDDAVVQLWLPSAPSEGLGHAITRLAAATAVAGVLLPPCSSSDVTSADAVFQAVAALQRVVAPSLLLAETEAHLARMYAEVTSLPQFSSSSGASSAPEAPLLQILLDLRVWGSLLPRLQVVPGVFADSLDSRLFSPGSDFVAGAWRAVCADLLEPQQQQLGISRAPGGLTYSFPLWLVMGSASPPHLRGSALLPAAATLWRAAAAALDPVDWSLAEPLILGYAAEALRARMCLWAAAAAPVPQLQQPLSSKLPLPVFASTSGESAGAETRGDSESWVLSALLSHVPQRQTQRKTAAQEAPLLNELLEMTLPTAVSAADFDAAAVPVLPLRSIAGLSRLPLLPLPHVPVLASGAGAAGDSATAVARLRAAAANPLPSILFSPARAAAAAAAAELSAARAAAMAVAADSNAALEPRPALLQSSSSSSASSQTEAAPGLALDAAADSGSLQASSTLFGLSSRFLSSVVATATSGSSSLMTAGVDLGRKAGGAASRLLAGGSGVDVASGSSSTNKKASTGSSDGGAPAPGFTPPSSAASASYLELVLPVAPDAAELAKQPSGGAKFSGRGLAGFVTTGGSSKRLPK